jgi:hypothetical protein
MLLFSYLCFVNKLEFEIEEAGNGNSIKRSRKNEKRDIIYMELFIQYVFCEEKKLCFYNKIVKILNNNLNLLFYILTKIKIIFFLLFLHSKRFLIVFSGKKMIDLAFDHMKSRFSLSLFMFLYMDFYNIVTY